MLRRDKRNLEEVKKLIKWVQEDDFEQVNVLSVSKLRKRYDNLVMKMNKQEQRPNNDDGSDSAKQRMLDTQKELYG